MIRWSRYLPDIYIDVNIWPIVTIYTTVNHRSVDRAWIEVTTFNILLFTKWKIGFGFIYRRQQLVNDFGMRKGKE